MNIYKKAIWVAVILLVFTSIAVTNVMDRNRFTTIKDAVITIYEDRLIAKNIIVDLSHLIYEKELATVSSDAAFFENRNKAVNNNIDELIIKFQTTKLTPAEEEVFTELQTNYNQLQRLENELSPPPLSDNTPFKAQIDKVQESLDALSAIQLEEGKRQLVIGKKAVEEIELFTTAENVLFVLLVLVLLAMLFLVPVKKSS
jgi:hypothetical protein